MAAGEPLPGRLHDQMLAAADRAFNGYGPTEATIYSTIWPLEPGVPCRSDGHCLAPAPGYLTAGTSPAPPA